MIQMQIEVYKLIFLVPILVIQSGQLLFIQACRCYDLINDLAKSIMQNFQ